MDLAGEAPDMNDPSGKGGGRPTLSDGDERWRGKVRRFVGVGDIKRM